MIIKKTLKITAISLGFSILISFLTVIVANNYFSLYFPNQKIPIKTTTAFQTIIYQSVSNSKADQQKILEFKPLSEAIIKVSAKTPKKLIVSGETLGIKFFTEGVLVISISDIEVEGGKSSPAYLAGIRVRDIITKINDTPVNTNEQVSSMISSSNGEKLKITVRRNNSEFECYAIPVKSKEDGKYKLGMYVRDSTAGVGTITYIDPETNEFGALGHGICDPDTSNLMPLSSADVYKAEITSVVKGQQGIPGELCGRFIENNVLGKLYSNTDCGIFGTLNQKASGNIYDVATKSDVKAGKAKIICTVDTEGPKEYEIEIIKSNKLQNGNFRDMTIKVTDQKLINITGGIVQGMSGSPIIQNNKLIGAVTHVFVNDPKSGYGIFIENMFNANSQSKLAS